MSHIYNSVWKNSVSQNCFYFYFKYSKMLFKIFPKFNPICMLHPKLEMFCFMNWVFLFSLRKMSKSFLTYFIKSAKNHWFYELSTNIFYSIHDLGIHKFWSIMTLQMYFNVTQHVIPINRVIIMNKYLLY